MYEGRWEVEYIFFRFCVFYFLSLVSLFVLIYLQNNKNGENAIHIQIKTLHVLTY